MQSKTSGWGSHRPEGELAMAVLSARHNEPVKQSLSIFVYIHGVIASFGQRFVFAVDSSYCRDSTDQRTESN